MKEKQIKILLEQYYCIFPDLQYILNTTLSKYNTETIHSLFYK